MLNLTNSQSRIINLKNLFNEFNKLLHKTIILTMHTVEINLIGRFLLIFDKFQNVTVFSKANISAILVETTHVVYQNLSQTSPN